MKDYNFQVLTHLRGLILVPPTKAATEEGGFGITVIKQKTRIHIIQFKGTVSQVTRCSVAVMTRN